MSLGPHDLNRLNDTYHMTKEYENFLQFGKFSARYNHLATFNNVLHSLETFEKFEGLS